MTIAINCLFPKPQGFTGSSEVFAVLLSVPERPAFKESASPACDWGAFSMGLDSGGENGELEGDSVPSGRDESG